MLDYVLLFNNFVNYLSRNGRSIFIVVFSFVFLFQFGKAQENCFELEICIRCPLSIDYIIGFTLIPSIFTLSFISNMSLHICDRCQEIFIKCFGIRSRYKQLFKNVGQSAPLKLLGLARLPKKFTKQCWQYFDVLSLKIQIEVSNLLLDNTIQNLQYAF